MSERGLSSTIFRAMMAVGMMGVFLSIPSCSDPEVGSQPKMKKSKQETMEGIDGPKRTGKKVARSRAE